MATIADTGAGIRFFHATQQVSCRREMFVITINVLVQRLLSRRTYLAAGYVRVFTVSVNTRTRSAATGTR